jgi:peptidoglycan/LPS O-acetylase OafA/YrhL
MTAGNSKSSWHNTAMFLLILASLAMFGTIAYTITLQDFTYNEIGTITGLLITVTGILLGLSGFSALSKPLEKMKLQVTLAITTLMWLLAIDLESLTTSAFYYVTPGQRYFFLTGIALFTLLVVVYSLSTVEATKQRLLVEQSAKAGQSGPTTK